MNHIQFLLNKYSGLSGDDGNDYLVVDILVDHHPLTDFQWFATDFGALKESSERDGFFYILTCWCGEHECAGLKKHITVIHEADHIIWKIFEPQPEREFVFDKQQLLAAMENLIIQGNRFIKHLATSGTRGIEITPDRNNAFFVNPEKYRSS